MASQAIMAALKEAEHSTAALRIERELVKAREEAQRWKTKFQASQREVAHHESLNQFAAELSEARDPVAWEREVKKGTSKATAIVGASDWHLEEPVDAKTVNGLNSFNLSIAEKRVKKFFLKIPEYVDRYVPMAKELWIWAGGDFISGFIHPELAESNLLSPTEACMFWLELWNSGMMTLRKQMRSRKLIIVTSFDNHGRTTEKMRVATAGKNSYTQLMYWVAKRDWRNNPKVEWRIADGYHNIQNVLGRKVRFHHGHAIKYQGGSGGITIPVNKAINEWNKSKRVDLDFFGHWHQYMDGGNFIANGPLIGYGAYSLQIKAPFQHPTQTLAVFDRKFGLRQTTRIFVGDN